MMRKRNYLKIERGVRERRRRVMLVAAVSLVVLYLLASFIFGEMGVIKYFRMKAQYNRLTREIGILGSENAKLGNEVRMLRTDPDYIERVARDKLGLARPGEIVYYYADP